MLPGDHIEFDSDTGGGIDKSSPTSLTCDHVSRNGAWLVPCRRKRPFSVDARIRITANTSPEIVTTLCSPTVCFSSIMAVNQPAEHATIAQIGTHLRAFESSGKLWRRRKVMPGPVTAYHPAQSKDATPITTDAPGSSSQ